MTMKDENLDVPWQVQTLILSLKDKRERVHIRGNYRMRLDSIKAAIESAINDYDREMGTPQVRRKK
jgi:hypothetical protein